MKNTKKLNNLYVSEELDKRILDATIYKKEKVRKFKFKYALILVVVISLISTSVLAGDYIKSYVFKIENVNDYLQANYSLNDFVEVNNDFTCSKNLTLKEAQEKLGLDVLNFGEYNSLLIDKCDVLRDDDNNIRKVTLKTPDISWQIGTTSDENLFVSLEFLTKYATKEDIENAQNVKWISAPSLKEDVKDYHINSLDVDSKVIYKVTYTARNIFNYKNVVYQMKAGNMKLEKFMDMLENLK